MVRSGVVQRADFKIRNDGVGGSSPFSGTSSSEIWVYSTKCICRRADFAAGTRLLRVPVDAQPDISKAAPLAHDERSRDL